MQAKKSLRGTKPHTAQTNKTGTFPNTDYQVSNDRTYLPNETNSKSFELKNNFSRNILKSLKQFQLEKLVIHMYTGV
jgi:hypothetical protein